MTSPRPPRPDPSRPPTGRAPESGVPSGPRLVVTGPPGSGKSRLALAAFDAAVERDGPDAALLVLPTYGEVEHQKRLAVSRSEARGRREARAILDVSYATFTSLGERLVEGFRVRDLPSRRERDLLAEAALAAADPEPFRAVRDRPGFRARFLRLVKELKQTGEDPATLRARARAVLGAVPSLTSREHLEAFLVAWEAYDALLASHARPDHEDVLRALVARARGAASGLARVRTLVVDGFEDLTGVEVALLEAAADAVTGRGGRVVVTLPADAARPDVFARSAPLLRRLVDRTGFVEQRLEGFPRAAAPALVRLAQGLFAPRPAPVPRVEPGPDLGSIVGADPADEVERIGREVLRLRREEPSVVGAFRDVGIVVRRADAFGPAARRTLEALGIPVRVVSGGARLTSEPVVRAVRGPLGLLTRDEDAFDPMLLLDYLRWRALASGAPLAVGDVDALDIAWRRERMPATWDDARADLEARGGAVAEVAALLDALRVRAAGVADASVAWSLLGDALEALLPLPGAAGFGPDGRPLDPARDAATARARGARARLVVLVREGGALAARLGAGPAPTAGGASGPVGDGAGASPEREAARARAAREDAVGPVEAAVDDLLAAADEEGAEPPDRRLDAVAVLDVEEARHWELPVVFVAGLVEKAFPLHPREDVFLRDEDREALRGRWPDDGRAPPWRTAREAEDDERRFFVVAATRARRRLYLTRSAADEDGREQAASPFVEEVHAALGLAERDPARLLRPGPDVGRACPPPDRALAPRDLERFVAHRLGAIAVPAAEAERREAVALLATAAPRLTGVLARAARFLRATADPVAATARPRFSRAVEAVSPSSLNDGAACLHRLFLRKVVGVREDDASFSGPSFGGRELGTLLHQALEHATREPTASPDEVARAVVAARQDLVPDEEARAYALDEATRVVALFREREARDDGFAPRPGDLELRLGDGTPVRLGDGDGAFLLRGTLDRLDTSRGAGERKAVVVDYKTRPSGAKGVRDAMLALDDLQLPLYARAVESLRGVRVVALDVVAAMSRGREVVASAEVEDLAWGRSELSRPEIVEPSAFHELLRGAERRAAAVVAAARAGDHRKAPRDAATCEACAVRAVCRPDLARLRPRDDDAAEGDA
ncbi:MAG: PD-(D/E)XK nuclease family protein [Planctomycetes bacterium]|nr:PD-(D/E)XK nuclease family protein [Planctomycetota bacterium]